ncbi:hypothetical protein [Sphingopyxis indica]|uniref:Selenocysteine lyase/Cysteine desulfurase n=1 Tax=Sphingopyxis indica TaxID=436663 RepID=A0A239FVE3_9SPHN|nr:hypothetical protein [Sphingopyxis indica]SNS60735.1 hypothetical protein SAMN06295955_102256 [Sphingopyxis indica]
MLLSPSDFTDNGLGRAGRDRLRLAAILASGGDARIRPDAEGRNKYYASVLPSDALAYGSSTINSISQHSFDLLARRWRDRLDRPMDAGAYAEALAGLRERITDYFDLAGTAVVFAASGTDLEYIGLAAAYDGRPLTAVLLGRDEVGSGCVHSAAGRFFADETAAGAQVTAESAIDPAFSDTELVDVAIRDANGRPRASTAVAAELALHIDHAAARDRRAIVHVVHGSKSGLTLPAFGDVERLASAYADHATIVVDACQLRIAPKAVRRYLALGCVVLLTGSKFAGGPPFSGFALVPDALHARAHPLPAGFRRLASRAEWPAGWPGAGTLPASGNFGLLLRLEAALIEMERFAAIDCERRTTIAGAFDREVRRLVDRLEIGEVPGAGSACLASETLRTIDLSPRWPACDFEAARAIHATIARQSKHWLGQEIRLGQPVRTHMLPCGRAAGTLRLSLSMPLMSELAAMPDAALEARLERDLSLIGAAISASAATTLTQREVA